MKLSRLTFAIAVTASMVCSSAYATIYTHEISNPNGSDRAGDITNFTVQYDDYSEQLLGTFTISEHNGNLANTSWMVLSHGANPKGNESDHAILFMDYDSGTTWAYEYNGQNNPSSYQNNALIATYENSIISSVASNTRTVTFNLEVNDIQAYGGGANPEWTGVGFGETIGVWYHPAVGSFVSDSNGLVSYSVSSAGWYDTGALATTYSVPEISTSSAVHSILLLMGLGALVRDRRRKRLLVQP